MTETALTYKYDSTNKGYIVTGFSSIADDGKVEIPQKYNGESVIAIGDYAFQSCSSLVNVIILDSVTSIGSSAFENCTNLTSITIPNSVTSISNYVFYYCTSLASITIPDSVTSISDFTFTSCENLVSAVIGKGIKNIGENAFGNCNVLTKIFYAGTESAWNNIYIEDDSSIPTNATIYYYSEEFPIAFTGHSWHYVDGIPTVWPEYVPTEHGELLEYALSNDETYCIITGFKDFINKELIIPSSYRNLPIRSINSAAFNSCRNLKSVTIPDSIISIGSAAFYGCTNLNKVNLSTSNCNINSTAFKSCSNVVFILPSDAKVFDYRRTLYNYPYSATNASLKLDCLPSSHLDFLGFTFNGKHSLYDLNVYRVSSGNRYNDNLSPELQDKTAEIPGGDGAYYFGTSHKSKKFSINIAFDGLTERQLREWKQFCSAKEMGDLIFDETPYKAYTAKITGSPSMKYICFTINGERIYKGEGTIEFTCYWPYAHTLDSSTKVSSKLSSSGTFGADGKLLENYPEVVYITKNEWAPSSGLQESTAVCVGENPGDLSTPFILSYHSLGDGRKFKVGDAEIEVYGALDSGETLKWDSKIGLVYAENGQKEKRILPYKGQGCAAITAGAINTTVAAWSWDSDTTSWTETEAPTLSYHYWYY